MKLSEEVHTACISEAFLQYALDHRITTVRRRTWRERWLSWPWRPWRRYTWEPIK